MGWSVGYDFTWKRDIGYGVPATCDHPGCGEEIDRGLGYVCGARPWGGERGCGLFFCGKHQAGPKQLCARCLHRRTRNPFKPTPDTSEWIRHKLRDGSWRQWRDENPVEVKILREELKGRNRKSRAKQEVSGG